MREARASEASAEPAGAGRAEAGAGEMMWVEHEVVRDLRHSVGNYLHKLYYWADRIGAEPDAGARGRQVEQLNDALQQLQDYLEMGLRYFEPEHATAIEVPAADLASALRSILETECPGRCPEIATEEAVRGRRVHVDPGRFSIALRAAIRVLGGSRRDVLACSIALGPDESSLEVRIEARGGEAPAELPAMEWAIARKMVEMQGGSLRVAEEPNQAVARCLLHLPLVA